VAAGGKAHLVGGDVTDLAQIEAMFARIRMAGLSIYAASKAAVDAFTRNLAIELTPRGLTINSMNVGTVATEMTARIEPETMDVVAPRAQASFDAGTPQA